MTVADSGTARVFCAASTAVLAASRLPRHRASSEFSYASPCWTGSARRACCRARATARMALVLASLGAWPLTHTLPKRRGPGKHRSDCVLPRLTVRIEPGGIQHLESNSVTELLSPQRAACGQGNSVHGAYGTPPGTSVSPVVGVGLLTREYRHERMWRLCRLASSPASWLASTPQIS